MAKRKNSLSVDFSVFSDLAEELDTLGADLQSIFTDVMEQEGETVAEDTKEAVKDAYLPAKGEYSKGDTEIYCMGWKQYYFLEEATEHLDYLLAKVAKCEKAYKSFLEEKRLKKIKNDF